MKVERNSPTPKTVIKPTESNDLDLLRGLLATSTTQKTTTVLHEHKTEVEIVTTETTSIETSTETIVESVDVEVPSEESDLYSDEEFYSDYEKTNDSSSSSSTTKSLFLSLLFVGVFNYLF